MTKQFERNSKVLIGDVLSPVPKQKKIKKSEYQETGLIPVIDQGSDFIAGYTDNLDCAYRGELPVIVFGDHTRVLKFVSFRFSAGADGTQVLKPIQEFDERYFYYSLVALDLKNYGYERHFKYLKEEKIIFRPLPIQRKIAAILSAYDDLIENNIHRIQILEEMAQRIYREWFIHFRYPGHENDKMMESELGPIPDVWEVKKLEDLVLEIIDYRGKTPKKLGSDWSETGILAISAKNIKQGKLINLEKSKYVDEELYKKWMKSELRQYDILMTSEAPLGEIYFLIEFVKYCLSQRVFAIRANPQIIEPSILYSELGSPIIQEQIKLRRSGTTVAGIRQAELRNVPIIIPSKELQENASKKLISFFEEISALQNIAENLRHTRDLLLCELISGKIDVSELDIDMREKDESL